MAVLEDAGVAIVTPIGSLWQSFVAVFPGLVAALIIIVLGYFISLLLGHVVKFVLGKLGADKIMSKVKAPDALQKFSVSGITGRLTKWYVFILFLGESANVMNLGILSNMFTRFVLWLPQLIIAMLAVFVGFIVAYYVGHIIEADIKMKGSRTMARVFEYVILFIAFVIALEQIGIQVDLLKNTFLILIGALGLGVAIAIGLSFGLGLKGNTAKMFADLKRKF
ncbi:MAG: hypothetical protein PHO02_04230 [Candidatus Nanoarchaeia archaeon]|nr:hypothetical protein [Candidatus Nanoarchaeia archaeon]